MGMQTHSMERMLEEGMQTKIVNHGVRMVNIPTLVEAISMEVTTKAMNKDL